MTRIIVIPDTQCKPGQDFSFLSWIGKYVADKKPDVLVQIGDFADMSSLSSYDIGKKSFEGRRYTDDIEAANKAMDYLMAPILKEQLRLESNKKKKWKPRLVLTMGNHSNRIDRAIENDRKLEGLISTDDLNYKEFGWEVIPFLEPIVIENIVFCHYLCSGVMGRPITTARMLLTKKHMSCIVGHQQGRDVAYSHRGDGRQITSIIAGSCLAPHHKVLTSDLRYVELGSVRVGDTLVSFDEHLGEHHRRGRRFKTGKVTHVRTSIGELYKVKLASGKEFITTKDHMWLTRNCVGVMKWQETQNLTVNKNHVNQNTKIAKLFDEWETDNSREGGWLAGMYDGEGSLYCRKTTGGNCTQLAISQSITHNPKVVLELEKVHLSKGFKLTASKTSNCHSFRIPGGQTKVAKFLGTIRPQRLLDKFKPELLGTMSIKNKESLDTFLSVEPIGRGEYVEIAIDANTMIVEGYPHHNCYEHNESYLNHQTNEHWRGIVVLNEVVDGTFDESFVSLTYLRNKYGN